MASNPRLSVVLPVFNEEANIGELHQRLVAVLTSLDLAFEVVIYIDDGSSDRSRELVSELAKGDSRVGVLVLSRNFGHQVALTAGLDHASGQAVVLMDSDLQDPPELIPESWSRDGRKASTSFTLGERRGRVSPPSSVPAPLPSIVSFGLSLPSPFLLIRATSDYFPVVPPTPSVHFANDGGFCGGSSPGPVSAKRACSTTGRLGRLGKANIHSERWCGWR